MSLRAGLWSSMLTGLSALMLSACTTPAALQAGAGDTMMQPLTATPGDATRGRAIVANRQVGLCLLCHTGPFPEERFQGNLAPSLAGAGSRWSEGQLRLRISDARRVNPGSIMPAYHAGTAEPAARVASGWKDRPILDAQQIEDVVAFLSTLRE
jgi:L-cysteine S-thiosulfotransferase